MTEHLSPHFTLEEMTRTTVMVGNMHLENVPGPVERANLVRLCESVLEPLRELVVPRLGRPIGALLIGSGYRNEEVNRLDKGAAKSAHLEGRAADVQPADLTVFSADIMDALVASTIPFDSAIYERMKINGADKIWVHVQVGIIASAPDWKPRREALMRVTDRYMAWDPAHARVVRG